MDAIVFFTCAILVSSVLLSFATRPSNDYFGSDASSDAARLLDSVLSASIGTDLTVEADWPVRLSRQSLVRDCLALEGSHLVRGGTAEGFSGLNRLVMALLEECAPRSMDASLLFVYSSYSEPLLALPHLPDEEGHRVSSSVRLALEGGTEMLLVLVLSPSTPSEFLQV